MSELSPYTLDQAQLLVDDAERRGRKRHNMWRALEKLYRTGQAEGAITEEGQVPGVLWDEVPGLTLDTINFVLPHLSLIMTSVAERDPSHVVEPYAGGPPAERGAVVGRKLLSYWWKRTEATEVLRDMVHDAVIVGSGFMKVGWAYDEVEELRDEGDLIQELAGLLERDRRDARLAEDRDDGDLTPLDELVDMIDVTSQRVLADEPYVSYVSPYNIFVPPNARRMSEARWVAERVVLPLDEVQANEAFDSQARDALTSAGREAHPEQRSDDTHPTTGSDHPEDDPLAEVELFEFYDMRTRTLLVFQRDGGRALYEGDIAYSHRHPPYVHMRNFEDGGTRFWPFGDLENVAAIQRELNDAIYEQMDNWRRSGQKHVVDEDYMTDGLRELLESDVPDISAAVALGGRDVREIIQTIEKTPLPPDVYQAVGDLKGAMYEVLGVNDFEAGGVGADRMSATAAAVVDGVATMRASDKKAQVEKAAAHAGLQILLLCQEFMDVERAIRVTGLTDDTAEWLAVSKRDLIGEYQVSVESGSTSAVNPATRRQQAIEAIGQIIPAMEASGFDSTPMWRLAIRDLGYDPDQVLSRPEPEPEQQAPPQEGAGGPALPDGMPQPSAMQPGGGNPDLAALAELGGPPVPAGTGGEIAL